MNDAITLGQVLAMVITVLGAVIGIYVKHSSEIAVLKSQLKGEIKDREDSDDEFKEAVSKIDAKLDGVIGAIFNKIDSNHTKAEEKRDELVREIQRVELRVANIQRKNNE